MGGQCVPLWGGGLPSSDSRPSLDLQFHLTKEAGPFAGPERNMLCLGMQLLANSLINSYFPGLAGNKASGCSGICLPHSS